MKKFLTKNEACAVLKEIENTGVITTEQAIMLSSIRVCLAGDERDFYFWGNKVEDVRPLFKKCVVPDENSTEDIVKNYEAYLTSIDEACKKFTSKKEE